MVSKGLADKCRGKVRPLTQQFRVSTCPMERGPASGKERERAAGPGITETLNLVMGLEIEGQDWK